jgi:hypothetical protein
MGNPFFLKEPSVEGLAADSTSYEGLLKMDHL